MTKGQKLIKNLFKATIANDVAEVKNLLNAGTYLNATDDTGRTPLHYAATQGNHEMVNFLIESGANIDQGIILYTDTGPVLTEMTPIEQAAWHEQYSIMEELLLHGADLDVIDDFGNSLLMRAVLFGNNVLAEKLISLGAVVNSINFDGKTALHIAVEQTNREITTLLIKKDARIIADKFGYTALDLGIKNGFDMLIRMTQKEVITKNVNSLLNNIFKKENEIELEVAVVTKQNESPKRSEKIALSKKATAEENKKFHERR